MHRAKTSTLTPSFYCSFPMPYTWLTFVPSLKKIMIVHHFRSREVTAYSQETRIVWGWILKYGNWSIRMEWSNRSFTRKRWVTQRNTILNVKTELFWKLFRTSHRDKVLWQSSIESHCKQGRSRVNFGDVMLNSFQSDAAGDANN